MNKDEILSRIDPEAFYRAHLGGPLLGTGRQRKARCPFHPDADPSFAIDTTTGLFFCHGCGEKGGLVDYAMKTKGVDFPAALEYLNEWAGGPSSSTTGRRSAGEKAAQGKRTPGASSSKATTAHTIEDIKGRILRGGYRYQRQHVYSAGHPVYIKAVFRDKRGDKQARFFTLIDAAKGLYCDGRKASPVLYNATALDTAGGTDPVLYVEGERDVDELTALGLIAVTAGGVNEWKADFAEKFRGRHVVILSDNDEPGRTLARKVAASLRAVASSVKIIELPGLSVKGDVSDFIETRRRAGKTDTEIKEELQEIIDATAEIPDDGQDKADREWLTVPEAWPYFIDDQGNVCKMWTRGETSTVIRLANFDAGITQEIIEDDGTPEPKRYYLIEGRRGAVELSPLEVSHGKFDGLQWHRAWGSQTVIEPGTRCKDLVRHSIETRSGNRTTRRVFSHTGWAKIGDKWGYLTSAGAIGVGGVEVRLRDELQRYCVPLQPEAEAEAINASLSFLDVTRREISIPLWLIAYLSPLTSILMPQFTGFVYGECDTTKTTLTCLALCHFGDFSQKIGLPNFSDTSGSLQLRSFVLKDILMVIDDFHPSVNRYDSDKMQALSQSIIRGVGNRTGRGRLTSDVTPQARYYPRGMIAVTAEKLPAIQSTRARTLTIEMKRGDVNLDRLTDLQAKAAYLPDSMSSYVNWLLSNRDEIESTHKGHLQELRAKSYKEDRPKLAEHVAQLQFTAGLVCEWLCDRGAISQGRASELSGMSWDVLMSLSREHGRLLSEEDPVTRFSEILAALIYQGAVRITDRRDEELCIGSVNGRPIGYHDDTWLYLIPEALWREIEVRCRETGSNFPVDRTTLFKSLRNRDLTKHDPERLTSKFRPPRSERTINVLQLKRGCIYAENREHREQEEDNGE